MANIQDVVETFRACASLIWIDTYEERRVIDEIVHSEIVGLEKGQGRFGLEQDLVRSRVLLFLWSQTQGMVQVTGGAWKDYDQLVPEQPDTTDPLKALDYLTAQRVNFDTTQSAILIMQDLPINPLITRKLKDISLSLSRRGKTVIIIRPISSLPPDLATDIPLISYELPTAALRLEVVNKIIQYLIERADRERAPVDSSDARCRIISVPEGKKSYRVIYSEQEKMKLSDLLEGLTHQEILFTLSKTIHNTPKRELLPEIVAEEVKKIERSKTVHALCQELGLI